MVKTIEVVLRDNDVLHMEYHVGTYRLRNPVIPSQMYRDIFDHIGRHYISMERIIDAFVNAWFDGIAMNYTIDGAMILEMEVLDEDC